MAGNKQYFIMTMPQIIFEYGLNIQIELKLFFAKLYLFTYAYMLKTRIN